MAVAVRKPNGEIEVMRRVIPSIGDRYPILKWPVLRGAVVMIQALFLGVSSLNFSAEAAFEEAVDKGTDGTAPGALSSNAGTSASQGSSSAGIAIDPETHPLDHRSVTSIPGGRDESGSIAVPASGASAKAKDSKVMSAAIILSVLASIAVGLGLFFLLPLAMTDLVKRFVPALQNGFAYNLVDGAFRITVFLIYLSAISLLADIKRVFEYHGAEHKTVYSHEKKEDLTVENVRRQSRLHPRCGTSFLLFVMVVSILVFSLLPTRLPFYVMIFPRLAMVPLIAGLSYEAIRWSARKNNAVARALVRPGLWMQRLTTREPDDQQIAVAIRALREALAMEQSGGFPAVPV